MSEKKETVEDIVREMKMYVCDVHAITDYQAECLLCYFADRIEAAYNAELAAFRRSKHSGTHVEYAVGTDGPYGIVVEGPTYATKTSALISTEYSGGFVVSRRVDKWVKEDAI